MTNETTFFIGIALGVALSASSFALFQTLSPKPPIVGAVYEYEDHMVRVTGIQFGGDIVRFAPCRGGNEDFGLADRLKGPLGVFAHEMCSALQRLGNES